MSQHKKANKKRPTRLLVAAIAVGVVVVGIGVWWFFVKDRSNTATVTPAATDLAVEARALSSQGKVDEGVALYDKQIDAAADQEAEKALFIEKVNYLTKAGQLGDAIAAAREGVEKYKDDMSMHGALAQAYEANGQAAEALAEYKAALSLYDGIEAAGRFDPKARYEAKIQELEG